MKFSRITLNKYKPRDYQLPIVDALENKGYKRILAVMPRRSGKDITAWNLMIRAALLKVGVYFYCAPTYSQARKIIWDSITNDGFKFTDYIPSELIDRKNDQQMKIHFKNNSLIQVIGSDSYDQSLVGSNPQGIVFTEWALSDPRAYQFARPILSANDGWAIFITTVRGKNHLWELYNVAKSSPDWFCYKLTLDDTKHIPLEEIERDRKHGIMSEDLIQQEYYCSWEMGVEGSYYAKYLDQMRIKNQIGPVSWENGFAVHTAWDIGVRDSTCIIFFQTIGQTVRIIDCYENNKEGFEHYASYLQSKPYKYGKHFAPADISVREWGTGLTRIEKARQLGVEFEVRRDHSENLVSVVPNLSVADGIEAVRSSFGKMWIDENNCSSLIKALENYRQEWDTKKKIYKSVPLHNWACFSGETLVLTRNGMRQIMDVTHKDLILTSTGWHPCRTAKKTGINAPLVEVLFKDGTKVKCTPEHKFLTVNGWKYAKDLTKHTKIQSSLMNSSNILMDIFTDCGLANAILQKEESHCIDPSGKMLLEKSQKIVTFIIETITPLITTYGTLNASQKAFICRSLDQIIKDLVKRLEMLRQNGTDRQLEDCGISDMLNDLKDGRIGREKKGHVYSVPKNLSVLLERMVMNRNFVTPIARPLIIEGAKSLNERADVYCINVPDICHFSLSNGAIVHNSHYADAMRYLCLSLSKTQDDLSAEELNKRYYEAMNGNHQSYPFRSRF